MATSRREPRRRPGSRPVEPRPVSLPDPLRGEWRLEWPLSLAALCLAWVLLFFPHLLLGRVFVLGDAGAYRPFAEFSRARWHTLHQRTYWNPYVVLGFEQVASLADSRPQYLPGPLLDVAEAAAQPPFCPQLWLLLAHLLGALAVMVLARRMFHARGWGALAGGLIWLLSVPLLVPFAFGHDAQLVSTALTPVFACFVFLAFRAPTARAALPPSLGLALTLALQVLHGHPQLTVYSAMFGGVLALQQAFARRRPARFVFFAIASLLGIGMGCAVWWPAILFSAQSFRGGGATPGLSLLEVLKFSPGWRDALSFVWPFAVGYGGPSYWGALPRTDYAPYLGSLALALALAGRDTWAARRSDAALLWWALAVATLLSLGTTLGPLYGLVRQVVPLWSKFRIPFYLLVVSVLALALLASRAASAPPADGADRSRRLRVAVAVALALCVLVGFGLALGPFGGFYRALAQSARPDKAACALAAAAQQAGWDLVWRAALVGLALWLLRGGLRMPRRLAPSLAVACLVALDLGSVSAPAVWRAAGPPRVVESPPPSPLAEVAARDPKGVAYVGYAAAMPGGYHEAYTNFWVAWRARCLTGLPGPAPDAWRRVIRDNLTSNLSALRAWGVRYIDVPAGTPMDTSVYRPVLRKGPIQVCRLRNALGRAYTVPMVMGVPDEDVAAEAMAHPGFDPALVAVTADASVVGEYAGSRACTLRWLKDEPEHIALRTDAPDRSFLVITDSHVPGWTAEIDGQPVPFSRVDLLIRGLAVPAGSHRVEMRYRTAGMATAVGVTQAAMSLWMVLLVVAAGPAFVRFRRARKHATEPPRD